MWVHLGISEGDVFCLNPEVQAFSYSNVRELGAAKISFVNFFISLLHKF